MKRVCLDNHIMIWGIRGYSTQGQEGMVSRAQELLSELVTSQSPWGMVMNG